MALEQKHQEVFRSECNILSQAVLGSLLKLAVSPKDKQELSKLIQSADTIMGNSRFLEDKELEQSATEIVKSFTNISDVRKKIDQFSAAFEQFGLLVGKNGACPKGYMIVNGKCVMDTKSNKLKIISHNQKYV